MGVATQRAESSVLLRVFTHPACSGCPQAVRDAWEVASRYPEVELRTIALDQAAGLAEARSERVTTIPTLIVSAAGRELARWVGAPPPGELAAGLRSAVGGAT